jgi:hypothetical protein
MKRAEALTLIDDHKNKMINPMEMLTWTWLRVIINQISDEEWEKATWKATEILAR